MFVFAYDRKLLDLIAAILNQPCAELLLALVAVEMQRPVFTALEILYLLLALDEEPQRGALHPAGRQAWADFFPQQGRQIETNQVIERPARLLCVHQRHGDTTGMGNRFLDRGFGDLVEHDPVQFLVLQQLLVFKDLRKMPGNGFALAVGVGREVDVGGFRHRL